MANIPAYIEVAYFFPYLQENKCLLSMTNDNDISYFNVQNIFRLKGPLREILLNYLLFKICFTFSNHSKCNEGQVVTCN